MIKHIVTYKTPKIHKEKIVIVPRMAGKIKEYINSINCKSYCIGTDWNGYGYANKTYYYEVNRKQLIHITEILNQKKKTVKNALKTAEQKIENWCRRLCKLTSITMEKAKEIAKEKIDYKYQKINEMIERQAEHYSVKRQSLINKMTKANPLRRIQNVEHAQAILSASYRHNETCYDEYLNEAHELIEDGFLEKGTAKEYARNKLGRNHK